MAKFSWTVAASTGVCDEESRKFLVFGRLPPKPVLAPPSGGAPSAPSFTSSAHFGTEDSVVSLMHNAQKGSYNIRYHVPLEPITDLLDFQTMQVRYFVDDHALGQVVVILKKYSLESPLSSEGAEIISVFNSNDHSSSNSYQLQSVQFNDSLNDQEFAYFIEVLLINHKESLPFGGGIPVPGTTRPSPAIAAIRLRTNIT